MLKKNGLMESLSANLHNFLKIIGQNLSLPNKKFLRDGLIGLLRAGKPIVCRMARQMPNHHAKFTSRRDRLEEHLIKKNDFDDTIKEALPHIWLPFIKDDTPIILDLSDLGKPLAKKMDYLATVRDGSTGKLVNGYWLVELYASVSRKTPYRFCSNPSAMNSPNALGRTLLYLTRFTEYSSLPTSEA